ncbi:MAG TPA: hypothetical protein P5316_19220 [Phycisphaerae bacterium]|nr:hypothetical protein [Phycisphaerae bacterium]
MDLKVLPIHHRLVDQVRAHVLPCILAYRVWWHMRQVPAPIVFDDDEEGTGEADVGSGRGPAVGASRGQGPEEADRRRRAGAQLPDALGGLGDAGEE